MNSQEIYQMFGQEVYLFILKKIGNKDMANDIFQSTFLKVHKNVHQLKAPSSARAWLFQITRNEIANYFKKESGYKEVTAEELEQKEASSDICCFDRFIDELPDTYREVVRLTYLSGKKQEEVASQLDISVTNVKARIRRSKALLKERFQECCKYEVNVKGKLIGTPDCQVCK